MNAASLACLAALSSGCFVQAVSKTTAADLGTLQSSPRHGVLGPLTLNARAQSATLFITAARARQCTSNVYSVTEIRTSKTAKLDGVDLGAGGGGGPAAALFFAVAGVAAVTGVISGTIAMIELAADKEHVERRAKFEGVRRYACPVFPANLPVEVLFASGTLVTSTTDRHGHVRIDVPADEPAQGDATVRAADAQFHVTYARSPEPTLSTHDAPAMRSPSSPSQNEGASNKRCAIARVAMFKHINSEPDRVRRAVLIRAAPSCSTTPTEDTAWNLTKSAALAASEGNCGRTRTIASQVAALDGNHYQSVFLTHIEIAGCAAR